VAKSNSSLGLSLSLFNLIILCVVGRYLAITVPFIGVAVFFIQRYYLYTSRQVRLLDIEAKSPLYTHFIETISGLSTIRAYGWESLYRDQCEQKLNISQKPFYMLLCIQQWLDLVLNLLVGAIAVILVAILTSLRDRFSAGSVGVALNLVLSFELYLTNCVRAWTQLEISIGAVSRVKTFLEETPSETGSSRQHQPAAPPHQAWPSHGAIEFEEVTASYR
jgi:ATP-binding cassette, subfamily C (CFTR/MRP), member 1